MSQDFTLHQQPSGTMFVHVSSRSFVRLSQPASELAMMLARESSFDEAVRVVAHSHGGEHTLVGEALERACQKSPLTADWPHGGFPKNVRVTGNSRAYIPIAATLQLTNVCNLTCDFCYAASGRALPNELDTHEWRDALERMAGAGVIGVNLSGGEPTIARHFKQILTFAGVAFDTVNVVSNGWGWSDDLVGLCRDLGNIKVQISVDGPPAIHDKARGRSGSFDRAMSTILRLSQNGVETMVSTTIMESNEFAIEELSDAVAQAGSNALKFGYVQVVGRADDAALPTVRREDLAARIAEIANKHKSSLYVFPWDACDEPGKSLADNLETREDFRTPAYLHWYVMANGDVTPCPIEGASFGNIRNDSLEAIGNPERISSAANRALACRCIGRVNVKPSAAAYA